jgi:hypothetical protein
MRFQLKLPTASQALVALLIGIFFTAPAKLLENAVTGWIDSAIGNYFGLNSPSVSSVVFFIWEWIVPFAAAALVLVVYHYGNNQWGRPVLVGVRRTDAIQRIKVDPIIALGLFFLAAGVIVFGARLSHLSATPPFVGAFFSAGPEPDREGSPLGFNKALAPESQKQADGSIQIRTVGIRGKNVGNEEIQLDDAYIVSAVTGKRLELQLFAARDDQVGVWVKPSDANPIPPGADIQLKTEELNGTQGLQEADFLKEWGGIYLIADYNGEKHRINFDRKRIEAFFAAQRPQPIPPHVTVKKQ